MTSNAGIASTILGQPPSAESPETLTIEPRTPARTPTPASHNSPSADTSPAPTQPLESPARSGTSPSSPLLPRNEQELVPGTLLGGRYRITAPIGRGGMGRVYRAEDLKLGQTVALKFLPASLSVDPAWLQRLFAEVRTARQVTDSNVCRVHDIVEADSHHFLTMEYVEGENLAALMNRFGRLPTPRALEMAAQICTGLAAAHAQSVLHRDLKPANVMVDSSGDAKITDFGLATVATVQTMDSPAAEIAGTPGYIAPEILGGAHSSVRTDLYSLGILLYELLSGRRPTGYRETDSAVRPAPTPIRRYAPDVPPDVEKAVLRCLESDPELRPASVLELIKVLPRANSLESALARGETPSPEMVAAAGSDEPLRLWTTVSTIALSIAMLFGMWLVAPRSSLLAISPPAISPSQLRHEAESLLLQLGYPVAVYKAQWIEINRRMVAWKTSHKHAIPPAPGSTMPPYLAVLAHGEQGSLRYFYRQAENQSMVPNGGDLVGIDNPAENAPGMSSVLLDSNGHLIRFRHIPALENPAAPAASSPPDWTPLLKAAALDAALLHPVPPSLSPPDPYDFRQEWEGAFPGFPLTPIHVLAASRYGKLSFFKLSTPWSELPILAMGESDVATWVIAGFSIVILCGAIFLARRNLRLRRGDLRGAYRFAAAFFITNLTVEFLTYIRPADAGELIYWASAQVAWVILYSACVWICYMAIEPFARRQMPYLLIASTRLLSGRWRDVQVGRSVLAGTSAGILARLIADVTRSYLLPFGAHELPAYSSVRYLTDWRSIPGDLSLSFSTALLLALLLLVALVLLHTTLRRHRLAIAAVYLLLVLAYAGIGNARLEWPAILIETGLLTLIVFRSGLVAAVAFFSISLILSGMAWTTDMSSWLAPYMLAKITAVILLLAWAGWCAVGRRKQLPA